MPRNLRLWLGGEDLVGEVLALIKYLSDLDNTNIELSSRERLGYRYICFEGEGCEGGEFPEGGGHIGIRTSGTTGEPKVHWKNYREVLGKKVGRSGEGDYWLLTYNPARWAGLSVLLHCMKNKLKLRIPENLSAGAILDGFCGVTHISITPSLFRKLMMLDIGKMRGAGIKQLTFGGEWVDQKILDEARVIWPGVRVTTVYASTEQGDICASSDGLEGFPIEKMRGATLGVDGELLINGEGTGDLWKIVDGRYFFLGRKVEVINVGGAKITATQVEVEVRKVVGIQACRAFAIENPLLGQVVGLEYSGNIGRLDLKRELGKVLPRFAIPAMITQVQDIEITEAGKIKRT